MVSAALHQLEGDSSHPAVLQDYANPLTRFSMQDYPEDGEGRMSQVHHGEKMLLGLPEKFAPPSVCVDKEIFFVNELLQQSSRDYFIPKKFFRGKLDGSLTAEVLALGHGVSKTEVSVLPIMQIVRLRYAHSSDTSLILNLLLFRFRHLRAHFRTYEQTARSYAWFSLVSSSPSLLIFVCADLSSKHPLLHMPCSCPTRCGKNRVGAWCSRSP